MLLSIIRSHGADIGTVLMYILSILIIIFLVNPLHECAHGFVAYKLGNPKWAWLFPHWPAPFPTS